jgi:hypothetical protein
MQHHHQQAIHNVHRRYPSLHKTTKQQHQHQQNKTTPTTPTAPIGNILTPTRTTTSQQQQQTATATPPTTNIVVIINHHQPPTTTKHQHTTHTHTHTYTQRNQKKKNVQNHHLRIMFYRKLRWWLKVEENSTVEHITQDEIPSAPRVKPALGASREATQSRIGLTQFVG